jgi:hypothetical protein
VDGSSSQFHVLSAASAFGFFGLSGHPIDESYFRELALQSASTFLLILRPLQPTAAF